MIQDEFYYRVISIFDGEARSVSMSCNGREGDEYNGIHFVEISETFVVHDDFLSIYRAVLSVEE